MRPSIGATCVCTVIQLTIVLPHIYVQNGCEAEECLHSCLTCCASVLLLLGSSAAAVIKPQPLTELMERELAEFDLGLR